MALIGEQRVKNLEDEIQDVLKTKNKDKIEYEIKQDLFKKVIDIICDNLLKDTSIERVCFIWRLDLDQITLRCFKSSLRRELIFVLLDFFKHTNELKLKPGFLCSLKDKKERADISTQAFIRFRIWSWVRHLLNYSIRSLYLKFSIYLLTELRCGLLTSCGIRARLKPSISMSPLI